MTSEQRHREAHEGRLVVMDEPFKQAEWLCRFSKSTAQGAPGRVRCDHCRLGMGLDWEENCP